MVRTPSSTLDNRLTKGCRNRTPKSCKSSGGFTFWGLEKKTYLYRERNKKTFYHKQS